MMRTFTAPREHETREVSSFDDVAAAVNEWRYAIHAVTGAALLDCPEPTAYRIEGAYMLLRFETPDLPYVLVVAVPLSALPHRVH